MILTGGPLSIDDPTTHTSEGESSFSFSHVLSGQHLFVAIANTTSPATIHPVNVTANGVDMSNVKGDDSMSLWHITIGTPGTITITVIHNDSYYLEFQDPPLYKVIAVALSCGAEAASAVYGGFGGSTTTPLVDQTGCTAGGKVFDFIRTFAITTHTPTAPQTKCFEAQATANATGIDTDITIAGSYRDSADGTVTMYWTKPESERWDLISGEVTGGNLLVAEPTVIATPTIIATPTVFP